MIGQNNYNFIQNSMEATLNVQFTREKQQALLISSYKKAVALLHRTTTQQQGKTILLQILNNPDSYQPTLRQLRLSTLLSLAQLNKMQGLTRNALYYWHQSTKIESSFNIWVKIAQSLQNIREQLIKQRCNNENQQNNQIGLYEIQSQIEYSYKNSIKQSPLHWRPQLLNKLKQIYIRHGKQLQVKDLEQVIIDNNIQQIFSQKFAKDIQQNTEQFHEINGQIQQNSNLKAIKIPLYNLLSQQPNSQDNINTWDYLLSFCNFLLNQSIIGSKKSSKKYEEILNKFSKFSIFKTEIQLLVKNPGEAALLSIQKPQNNPNENQQKINIKNQNQMQNENKQQKQLNYEFEQQMGQQQNIELIQAKRLNQQISSNQKLYSFMVDIYRDISKDNNSSTQTKSKKSQILATTSNNKTIFQSLLDYFREIFISKSINLDMFSSLKYIDPFQSPVLKTIFNDNQMQETLFGSIIAPVIDGVNRITAQKQKQKEKQKQNKQMWSHPPQNQQDNTITTRERRSTLTPNPILSTPGRQRQSEQNKYNDQQIIKLKQQFFRWAASENIRKFTNIMQLTRNIVQRMLELYDRLNLLQLIQLEQSQNNSLPPMNLWLKSTNKLVALLVCKLLQFSQLSFVQHNSSYKKIISILLLKHLEQQNNINPNNPKLPPTFNYILELCHITVDNKIYTKSSMHNNSKVNYTLEQIYQLLHYLYLCIMLCSLPNSIDQQKLKMYIKKYEYFFKIKQQKQNQQLILKSLNSRSIIIQPGKFKQMIENRIRKSKLKQLSQQQFQESVLMASIDKLLKADMKTSQTIESVKSIMSISSGSILCYLKSFSKLVEILFNNLQSSNGFNTKFIQNALKVMEIPMLIQALHTKLTQDRKGQKQKQKIPQKKQLVQQKSQIIFNPQKSNQISTENQPNLIKKSSNDSLKLEYKLKISTLYNLIKIYLLNQLDQHNSSLCFRIILYLLEQALQSINLLRNSQSGLNKYYDVELQMEVNEDSQSIHFQYQESICKIIILFDSLIKMRQSNDVRKKFYHRILIKNIRYIYHNYNNHHNTNQIRYQIYKILNDTFHNKNYKPKKIQDCLGYFLMISRQFASQFDKQQVEFQQKMKRVFNQCYLIFKQEFNKSYRFCDRFCRAMEYFVYYMRKKIKQKEVLKFFTANQIICNCCQGPFVRNEVNRQKFDKEVLFIVAKYLQNKKNQQKVVVANNTNTPIIKQQPQSNQVQKITGATPQKQQKQQKLIELQQQIQRYYLKYFLLAVNTGKAWYQMLRFQISKVYIYFDALIHSDSVQLPQNQTNNQIIATDDNIQLYKHKFKYAKMIGSFIVRNFTSQTYTQAKQYALYRINIANTLKIRERKLNKKFSEISKVPQLMMLHVNKYMQGIITIMMRKSQKQDQQFAIGNRYPEVNFLIYTEYKLPFLINQCQNTNQNKNAEKTIISTLSQGIQLINQIIVNGENEIMIDQSNQNDQKLFQSRYKVKHLQKELKVEIIGCLSHIIIGCLQYLQNISFNMKGQSNNAQNIQKVLLKSKQNQSKDPLQQQKCFQKLELLSKLYTVINQRDSIFQQWKNEGEASQQKGLIQIDQTDASRKINFKDKFLFPDYLTVIQGVQVILKKFVAILQKIVKQNISTRFKKQNYCRFIFTANFWISKIHHKFGSREVTLSYVKEIANLKNQDLVNFYHHYQNQPTEQNLVLAEFYSRDIVFHYTKIEAVEHLLSVYSKSDTLQSCIMLIRKLAKMYLQKIDIQTDKQKQKKQQNKQAQPKQKEKDKKQSKQQKQKGKQAQKQKQKGKKSKKQGKQSKQKANKNNNKMERRIKWLYVLFLRGFQIYLQALVCYLNKKNQMIEQKFSRALVQFKNKIKRQVQKDKKKPSNQAGNGEKRYAARLLSDSQCFIGYCQARFKIKIRMKASKKKPQQQQPQQVAQEQPQQALQHTKNKQQQKKVEVKKQVMQQQQDQVQQCKQYLKQNEEDDQASEQDQQIQQSQNNKMDIEKDAIEQMEQQKGVMKQEQAEDLQENYNSDRNNVVNQCQQQQDQDQDDSDNP